MLLSDRYKSMIQKEINRKKITRTIVSIFLIIFVLTGTIWLLNKLEVISLQKGMIEAVRKVIFVVSVVLVASFVKRINIIQLFKLFDETEEQIFYSRLWRWTVSGFAIFIILFYFGVSLENITLLIGIMATGFAFAVREVLLSFFGWLILLRRKPFRIGDYIKIGEDEGRVVFIGVFYVLLDKTVELIEDYTRVPNRFFLEKSIIKLGTENIFEQLDFPITSPITENPADLKEIEKELSVILNSEHVHVHYDIKNDKLFLVIEYLTAFDRRKDAKTEVICLVMKKIEDKSKFNK